MFCDPDLYPVARADELELAKAAYPSIRVNATTYDAITSHLGIDPKATPTDSQMLAIYREWKMLKALVLEAVAGGYAFDYVTASDSTAAQAWHVRGTISTTGTIRLAQRDAAPPPPCPVCLTRGTLIATPTGRVPVQDLVAGMAVWTADVDGERMVGHVLAVGSTPVPPTHRVVHLVLADGRSLEASPGHPLPDGRLLGSLRPGDAVDGSRVVVARLVPYSGGRTFDLLPSGPTGAYWANGVLLASTLRSPRLR